MDNIFSEKEVKEIIDNTPLDRLLVLLMQRPDIINIDVFTRRDAQIMDAYYDTQDIKKEMENAAG